MKKFLKRLFAKKAARKKFVSQIRPRFESLESRSMLAVEALVINGITSTADQDGGVSNHVSVIQGNHQVVVGFSYNAVANNPQNTGPANTTRTAEIWANNFTGAALKSTSATMINEVKGSHSGTLLLDTNGLNVGTYGILVRVQHQGNDTEQVASAVEVLSLTITVLPTVSVSAANSTYDGAAYDGIVTTSVLDGVSDVSAYGTTTVNFYSDALATNQIPTPTNAGTYYAKAFFTSDGQTHDGKIYQDASSNVMSFTIAKADAALSVTGYTGGTYDGAAHTQYVTLTGVLGEELFSDSLTGTDAGSFSKAWSFGDENYESVSGTLSFYIAQATAAVVVSGYAGGTYDGAAHTQTVTVTGVGSDGVLYTTDLTGTNAGSYSQGWSYDSNPNYELVSGTLSFDIAKATATVSVTGYTGGTYDGAAHTQTVTVTGVGSDGVIYTTDLTGTNAGSYSQGWSYDSNPNYELVSGTLSFDIAQATATVDVTGYTGGTYDGSAHTQTVTVTGVGSDGVLYTTDLTGTNAGSYSQPWSFDSNPNYELVSGTLSFVIAKATATASVTGYTGGVYDGDAHTQTVTVTGVATDGVIYTTDLTGTNAGSYSQPWSFDSNPNYELVSGTLSFDIAKATATVDVTGYTGGTYNGSAHTQTVTVTGVGSDGVLYTTDLTGTNAGSYSQPWSFDSNPNYELVNGTLSFVIAKATATVSVTGYTGGVYDGDAHTQTVTVTGVATDGVLYTTDLTGTNAGSYSQPWSFDSNPNYELVSGTLSFDIAKATATVSVTGYTGGVYDGDAHTQTVTVTGVGGDGLLYTTDLTGTNAGSYSQAWSFDANPNYELVSGTLGFTIGALSLSDFTSATTQSALNISKNGTISFAISIDQSGIVDGQTIASLFNGATFTLKMKNSSGGWESATLTAVATVIDNVVYVNLQMNQQVYDFLKQGLDSGESNAAKASLETIQLSATSNDSNYAICADVLTRIFLSGKVTFT
jgi:hypothetical protein